MKVKFTFYFVLILFIVIACKPENHNTNSLDNAQIKKEIKEMFHNYHEAVKVEGLQGEFKYLDDSEDFFWVPPGYTSALNYDSVKQILIENDKLIKAINFSFDTLNIFPLTDSVASYTGIVNGQMTDTSNIISNFKVIESGTLIKRKDGWKLLNGQSRNLP